jgi:hypothetical protein
MINSIRFSVSLAMADGGDRGKYEPWGRLWVFDPEYFGGKLTYTDSRLLEHSLPES